MDSAPGGSGRLLKADGLSSGDDGLSSSEEEGSSDDGLSSCEEGCRNGGLSSVMKKAAVRSMMMTVVSVVVRKKGQQ